MAPRTSDARQRMTDSALALLSERGANGVTIDAVLARSGAPRGSVYHHFPGGRDELVLTAARQAGDFICDLIDAIMDPADVGGSIDALIGFWKQVVTDGDFAAGCPITTLAVDHRDDFPAATDLAAEMFQRWQDHLEVRLDASIGSGDQIRRRATMVIAAIEGGIVLARAQRSVAPLDDVGHVLRELLATSPA